VRRLRTKISSRSWRPALMMPQAEIAETTHTPKGWEHEPLRLIPRRVRIPVDKLSEDPRSRRRRTVPAEQLPLALKGHVEYVYVLTDLEGDAAEIGLWHRQLTRPSLRHRTSQSRHHSPHQRPLKRRREPYSRIRV
jgi:hypothetical protein